MVTKAPTFFVPAATPDSQESVYSGFAEWCHRPVPKPTERIYSITYIHDSEEWTATVGEALRGVRHQITRSHGRKLEQTVQLNDPAIVLAIFPGVPFMVVTNHRLVGNVGSAWENPFLAGQPKAITYFPVTM